MCSKRDEILHPAVAGFRMTMQEKTINIEYEFHKNQEKIFYKSNARYKIIAKGRRFGLTKGMANFCIEKLLEGISPILWVDTTYGNIEKYFDRYFLPVLKPLPKGIYKFRQVKNDLKINMNGETFVCDFRSADKPENIEGFGYALIFLNEAGIILKNRSLWEVTLLPMALDHKANFIIGGTPKGKRYKDKYHLFYELYQKGLTRLRQGSAGQESQVEGCKLKSEDEKSNIWESFEFTSYDNPLIDNEEIKELEKEIPPNLRLQEIYGKFIDEINSSIIKSEWFNYYSTGTLKEIENLGIYQSWDTAFKKHQENDYSVCTTWQVSSDGFYLIDLFKDKLEFPELKKKAIELNDLYHPQQVLIEDKASGISLIQELERNTRIPIKKIKTDKDKIARVNSITTLFESGKIFIPIPEEKFWIESFVNELTEFPNGEFDDAVDSTSQFLEFAKNIPNKKNEIIIIRRKKIDINKYKQKRK